MAEGVVTNICLGLLCGIPGSGKSSLANQIQRHAARWLPERLCVLLLHYDRLIPAHLEKELITQSSEQGSSLWKSTRNQILACVDCLLNQLVKASRPSTDVPNSCEILHSLTMLSHSLTSVEDGESANLHCLAKPSSIDFALWERFLFSVRDCVKIVEDGRSDCFADSPSWLVLIDDNMHYSSMRYEYCQLARKYEVGLCILYLACPLEEALHRNWSRTEGRVGEQVVATMHQRLEVPDSSKRLWEKYSVTVDGTATVDIQPILEVVQQAMADPQQPPPKEDMEVKVVSRFICSTNVIHQADQILRRCVSQRMVEAKGTGRSKEDLKVLSAHLVKVRTGILSSMKKGDTTLPFQPDESRILDASKDEISPLFQFVQNLFMAQTRDS